MRATLVLVCCLGATTHVAVAAKSPREDAVVWKTLQPAMLAYQAGGARNDFLATCRKLLVAHPHTRYTHELASLVAGIEADAKQPAPSLPTQASDDDAARYWIYQLRDVAGHQFSDPGYPELFDLDVAGQQRPTAAGQLVALGAPAIPRLIEALEDDTPTRTIAWQRSFYDVYFVLRRRDVAMKVLERITGCRFYEENATFIHLYMDKPERRQAALDNVKAWWKRSAGAAQAQMIRNQLDLMAANATLGTFDRISMLWILGELEGPEAVVPELQRMYAVDNSGLNSPVVEVLNDLDPQTPAREALARFWADRSRDGDYHELLRYGDARVYAEMARRFAQTGKLDPGEWNLGDQARSAAEHGQNWALPILADMLTQTKMTGARYIAGDTQPFCNADEAIEELARLTGRDFGYQASATTAARLAAIEKARQWWEHGGEAAMQKLIAQPHAVQVGDLLLSDVDLAALAHSIESPDARTRMQTLARLHDAKSFVVQRALVRQLGVATDELERRAILTALNPAVWQLPAIASVLAKPGDVQTRVLAAQRMSSVLANKTQSTWWVRIETREAALAMARAVARDASAPDDVRRAAAQALAAWGSFVDQAATP